MNNEKLTINIPKNQTEALLHWQNVEKNSKHYYLHYKQ